MSYSEEYARTLGFNVSSPGSVRKVNVLMKLLNCRRQGERTDLWVVRNNHMMPYLYWGFEQLNDDEIVEVLRKTGAVLFLSDFPQLTRGINHSAEANVTAFVQSWFSTASDEKLHQVNISELIRW